MSNEARCDGEELNVKTTNGGVHREAEQLLGLA